MQAGKFQFLVLTILVAQTAILTTLLLKPSAVGQNATGQAGDVDRVGKQIHARQPEWISHSSEQTEQLAAVVRRVLESELPKYLHGAADSPNQTASVGAATQPEESLSYEQTMQRESSAQTSHAIISSAINAGIWTQQHTQQLNEHIPNLSEAQRIQLLEQFHSALNRQQLHVEPEDMPIL